MGSFKNFILAFLGGFVLIHLVNAQDQAGMVVFFFFFPSFIYRINNEIQLTQLIKLLLLIKRSEVQSLSTPKNQLIFWSNYKELLSLTDVIITKVLLYILFICLRLHKHILWVTRKFKLFGGNNRHKLHFGCRIHRHWYRWEYFNCIYGCSSTSSMGSQKLSTRNPELLQHKYYARHQVFDPRNFLLWKLRWT